MCRKYDIDYLGEKVGTASVKKEGLYLSVLCKCSFLKEGIYKIDMVSGGNTVHLGTCIPEGDAYVLQKKVPVKSLTEGNLEFRINSPCNCGVNKLIPVATDKPFPNISSLKEGRLVIQNGESLISF